MALTIIDAMLRGSAIGLFALLAFMFACDWRRSLTARLGAVLCLGGACYVALILVDNSYPFRNPWRLPLHLMSLASPALFWLFAASWFDDDFRLRLYHWLFVAATVLSGFVTNYLFWALHVRSFGLALVWRLFSVVAIGLAIRATLKGWAADLVDSRRRVRIALTAAISVAILWVVMAELWTVSWPPPVGWRIANGVSMLLLAVTVAVFTLGWRDPALVAAPVRAVDALPRHDSDDSPLLARLDADMRHERLYRQDGLTITAVAARLGVPEYRLRRAINQGLGARNFNAYLNGFRIGEATDALADPVQRDVPILTIAMDAGFGSLAPFNRAFRDLQGCTPTEFRARALPR
jgi:AraC-like DNA-binding protein